MSLVLAFVLGMLYFVLAQVAPATVHSWVIFLAGVALITAGILLLKKPSDKFVIAKIITAVLGILVGLVFLPAFFFFKSQLRISSIFLSQAPRFVCSNCNVLAYVPLFLLLLIVLVVVSIFELLSFWSIPTPQFDSQKIFYSMTGIGYVYMSVLVAIQLLWGLSFLR